MVEGVANHLDLRSDHQYDPQKILLQNNHLLIEKKKIVEDLLLRFLKLD